MNTDIKGFIKEYLKKENMTLTDVVSLINKKRCDNKTTLQNINNKLTRGTIKFSEVLEIADILGYDVIFEKKTDNKTNYNSDSELHSHDKVLNNNLEDEIIKFTDKLISILKKVENDSMSSKLKLEFELLMAEKEYLSPQLLYLKYYTLFCSLMLMYSDGNKYIPVITYIRNIYLHGGFSTLSPDAQKEFYDMLIFLSQKDV